MSAEPTQSWFGPGDDKPKPMSKKRSDDSVQSLWEQDPGEDLESESRPGEDAAAIAAMAAGRSEAAPSESGAESQFFFQQARRLVNSGGNAFARLYRAFLGARAALGLALVATQTIGGLLGAPAPPWTLVVCMLYAVQAMVLWLWPPLQKGASARSMARVSSPPWWTSIGLDLLVFGVLHAFDRGVSVNYGAMLVMPVLMAGVLTPRLLALATAACAALLMLGVAGWAVLAGADVGLRMTQAGLVGSGFFVISLLASELASRLAKEERAARGSMEFARQQAQLNRLVIDEMQEGVMVVDRRGRVRAANPASRALLADGTVVRSAPFQLRGVRAWHPLVQAVEQAFADGAWPEGGRDVELQFDSGLPRCLRLRMRFTRRRAPDTSEDLCVLFLEDKRRVQARIQQDKLAAMGRVSAGIAHEFRNPLAAIAQANALLLEDAVEPRSQQLTRMVASNVQRLKRIVDDVLEVAPGAVSAALPVDAAALVGETCLEWARTNQLAPGPADPLGCSLPLHPLIVAFDPEHLRRVLVNLLDNAWRHAERGPGCMQVRLEQEVEPAPELAQPPLADPQPWVRLSVFNRGPAIPPDVERHLFEPFFSTRSRGSGLGLYICRELCERYGASIDYQRRHDLTPAGNEFSLRLRLLAAPSAPAAPGRHPSH
ncbi:two-component system sensor histidine kinase PilS (NtrC family) [Paucibacter oligotrophus]|uniref:histidine kinase n=1 Tax=Roseateles oligotrophus TaxID=1769250 RepID=A0A840L9Q3_9BURK|nr:PAS domain-containing sensor histidine kinase [Roseateles oligotrophus]MBB4845304.1 two-component system sensor histidine kinase PilS (NtrC family) [Roseateles oligotrophus]